MGLTINHEIIPSPPALAATVILLRDGTEGLEVLLVRRHGQSEVLGGAYVFPGGKLDPQDAGLDAGQLDRPPEDLQAALAQDDLDAQTASGLFVAALRETFEECSLLLIDAERATAQETQRAQTALRDRLDQGESFLKGLQSLGLLPLQTRQLVPWSRWISPLMPSMSRRRFDTFFFLALAPMHQQAQHDAREVTEALWLQPAQAIRRYWDGQMTLANVQLLTLMELARLPTAAQAMATGRKPFVVRPEPFDIEGQRVVCYPGDALHSQSQPIWQGPTRMTYRNGRFEPDGGLQALLQSK